MNIKNHIKFENNIWLAKIKVTPKANKSEFFSVLSDWTLKIRIKAIPENWKANKELISYLSKEFWVNKNNIEILGCKTEQVKRIKITLN